MIGLIAITGFNCVQAQNDPSDTLAITTVRDFYTAYMTEFPDLSSGHEHRANAILKKYCTANLIKKVPKLADQIDSDPFLKAQDSDSTLAKTLSIKRDMKRPSEYIVSYHDRDNTNFIIHVLVVKQKEGYKIANVW
jgi:hypothetical protein